MSDYYSTKKPLKTDWFDAEPTPATPETGVSDSSTSIGYYGKRPKTFRKDWFEAPLEQRQYEAFDDYLKGALKEYDDPLGEIAKLNTAKYISDSFRIPLADAIEDFQLYADQYIGIAAKPKTAWKSIQDSYRAGMLNYQIGKIGFQLMSGSENEEELLQAVRDLKSQLPDPDALPRHFIVEAAKYAAGSLPQMLKASERGAVTGAVTGTATGLLATLAGAGGAAAALAGPQAFVTIPAMALAMLSVGWTAGSTLDSYEAMGGLQYLDLLERGISPKVAAPLSQVSGLIQAAIETAQIAGIIGKIPGAQQAMKTAARSVSNRLLAGSTMANLAARTTATYGLNSAEEGVEEVVQQVTGIVSQIMADELQKARGVEDDTWTDFTPHGYTPEKVVEELAEAFKGGFMASLVLGVPALGAGIRANLGTMKRMKADAIKLTRTDFITRNFNSDLFVDGTRPEQKVLALEKIWRQQQPVQSESTLETDKDSRKRSNEGATEKIVADSEKEPIDFEKIVNETPSAKDRPDIERAPNGRLYTEHVTYASKDDGTVKSYMKVGDYKTGKLEGNIRYQIKDDTIRIERVEESRGDQYRKEMILELTAQNPGLKIEWDAETPRDKRVKTALITDNPRGKKYGLTWFASKEDGDFELTRAELRKKVHTWIPNLPEEEVDGAVALADVLAEARGLSTDDFLKRVFTSDVFGAHPLVDNKKKQKGGVDFLEDAKAIIYTTRNSDFSTWVHEVGHVLRRNLTEDLMVKAEAYYGVANHTWTRKQEEQFAEDWETYLWNGQAPSEGLKGLFDRFSRYLKKIYQYMRGTVDPRIKEVFDSLVAKPESPLADPQETPAMSANEPAAQTETGSISEKEIPFFQPYAKLSPEKKAAVDAQIDKRSDAARIRENMQRLPGTQWENAMVEGLAFREALERTVTGQEVDFDSYLNTPNIKKKLLPLIKKYGEEGVWKYVHASQGQYIGHPDKPVNSIASSFANCKPSAACANFCYAASGRGKMATSLNKAEVLDFLAARDPVRLGKKIAGQYKNMIEYDAQKALRFFDRGDINENWVKVIEVLNQEGVRAHIFSKRPELLDKVDDFNVRLLSVDATNFETTEGNNLPVSYAYVDPLEIENIEALKDRMGVILPVRIDSKILDQEKINALPAWTANKQCPIDSGKKELLTKKSTKDDEDDSGTQADTTLDLEEESDSKFWNCLKCDRGKGAPGCFFGKGTALVEGSYHPEKTTTLVSQNDQKKLIIEMLQQQIKGAQNESDRNRYAKALAALGDDNGPGTEPGATQEILGPTHGFSGRATGIGEGTGTGTGVPDGDGRGVDGPLNQPDPSYDSKPFKKETESPAADILLQPDRDEDLRRLAREIESPEDFADFITHIYDDTPGAASGLAVEEAKAWYRDFWQKQREEGKPETPREANDLFLRKLQENVNEGLRKFLTAIYNGTITQNLDTWQPEDAEEQAQKEGQLDMSGRIEREVHPLIYSVAIRVGRHNKDISEKSLKAILTIIRNAAPEYRKLYADLMTDPSVLAKRENDPTVRPKIEDPRLEKWEQMTIAERIALARQISDEQLASRVERGETNLEEIRDFIKRVTQERKDLHKELREHQEKIRDYAKSLNLYSRKISDLMKEAKQKDRRIAQLIESRAYQIENVKQKIRERDRDRRAAKKLRQQKLDLARKIMKPIPATVHYEYAVKIKAVQKLLDPHFRIARKVWEWELANLGLELNDNPDFKVILTPAIVDRIERKPLNLWTLDELEELAARVDSLLEEGKSMLAAKLTKEEEERKRYRFFITRTALNAKKLDPRTRKTIQKYQPMPPAGSVEQQKQSHELGKPRIGMELQFMNMRRVARILDGGKDGSNVELLVDRQRKAEATKLKARDTRYSRIDKLLERLSLSARQLYTEKISVGPLGTFTKWDVIAMGLLMRNEDQRMALVFGNFYNSDEKEHWDDEALAAKAGVVESHILKAIESLSGKEKEVMEAIAEDFDQNYDRLDAVVIDVENKAMTRTKGYFPIVRKEQTYTDLKDEIASDFRDRSGATNLPKRGFTRERIKIGARHQKPIKLDAYGTFLDAVDKQEHYIAYMPLVKELNGVYKSLQAGNLRYTIQQTYGPDYVEYIDQYVSELANPNAFKVIDKTNKMFQMVRGNLALGYLAWKTSGVLKQLITSPWPFLPYAGKYLFTSAVDFMTDFSGNYSVIAEKSYVIKHRSIDPSLQVVKELANQGKSEASKRWYQSMQLGMAGLEWADKVSVAIGWKAVYDKAIAEGKDEEEAIKRADDATLASQPSASPADLSPIFKNKSEVIKIVTQFASPLNVIWQQLRYDLPYLVKSHQTREWVSMLAAYAIAGVLLTMASQGDGDDDGLGDDIAEGITSQFTTALPLVGFQLSELVGALITGRKPYFSRETLPAAEKALSGLYELGKGDWEKALLKTGEGMGLIAGAPVSGIKELEQVFLKGNPGALVGRRERE